MLKQPPLEKISPDSWDEEADPALQQPDLRSTHTTSVNIVNHDKLNAHYRWRNQAARTVVRIIGNPRRLRLPR